MKFAAPSTAQLTLSGRELALQRRQAMALRGKVGAVKSATARPGDGSPTRPAMAMTSQASQSAEPMPQTGLRDAAALEDCGCGCQGAGICNTADPLTGPIAQATGAPNAEPVLPAMDAGSTRALARARRVALASGGKKGALRVAQATRLAAVLPQQDWLQAIDKGTSGREVARQRRLVRALVGREEAPSTAPRSHGRMRARNTAVEVPPKVALGHTLAGQPVSGTTVDSDRKVTGNETGACKSVTGTEYLSLEQFSSICGTKPTPGPRKVSVMSSQGGQAVSGVNVGRDVKVTGNESGASRQLTGSQYFSTADFGLQASRVVPSKVAAVQTLGGSTVTGTEVVRSTKVTGDDRGGCRAVTGTEYLSAQQLGAVCTAAEPVQPVAKVGRDRTWNRQTITGARLDRAPGVTGQEYGTCAPISGTSYVGRPQYEAFCQPAETEAQQAFSRIDGVVSAAFVTGDRPGAGGSATTGDQRGACDFVSGTPYVGADNRALHCGVSTRFVAPVRPETPAAAGVAAKDFSIRPPSRQARDRSVQLVTGSAFNGQRITGAANKGAGLITGTPEFRHREGASPAVARPVAVSAASKLTGEGSQTGARVSGSAWDASPRVTGTEGTSSLARNLSQRGAVRAMGMQAAQLRQSERAEPSESRVTGSSGQTAKGAAVTLSGGARG